MGGSFHWKAYSPAIPNNAMGNGCITGPRISLSMMRLTRACNAGGKSGPCFPDGPKGLKFMPGVPGIPGMPAISGIGAPPVFVFFGFWASAFVSEVEAASTKFVPVFVEISVETGFVPRDFGSNFVITLVGTLVEVTAAEIGAAGKTSVLATVLLPGADGSGCELEFVPPAAVIADAFVDG